MERFLKLFKIPDLRNRIFFILGLIVVFRVMAAVPVPGVNAEALQRFFSENQLFGLVSAFTGGGLDAFSIVMLGLGPYITASIIMQLLTMIFPSLEQMYKYEGELGRQKFNQYSRLLTVPLSMMQGYAFLMILAQRGVIGQLSLFGWINALLVIAAGSVFVMWLGELISEKNLGNGVSILIFAGIVAPFWTHLREALFTFTRSNLLTYAGFAVIGIIVIAGKTQGLGGVDVAGKGQFRARRVNRQAGQGHKQQG